MTFFIEVEPPVATLPDRVPAAVSAAAEEEVDSAAEDATVEEAAPPQAVRAIAAAAAPQTVINERRVIFFITLFPPINAGMHFRPMFPCFDVFSLGTALLYRTAMRAATMYAQNGGKAFAQAPAAVSSLRKAGMKSLYSNFTNRINMPKMPFSGWAKRQKAAGHSFSGMPGGMTLTG